MRRDELTTALQDLLKHVDRNTCEHEDTHRAGTLWTVCDCCGMKWADDEGGFQPHTDAPAVAQARAALSAALSIEQTEPVAWRDVEGYEGLYEVSTSGDVRSVRTGNLLAKNLAGSGYVKAELWKEGKRHQTTVHRLVADAFIERCGSEINHINGIKTDNRVSNLEWCSRSENVNHSYYAMGNGIHPIAAINPEANVTRLYRSVAEAARDGFGSAQIYRALRKPNRRVKGFHFTTYAHPPVSALVNAQADADVVEIPAEPTDEMIEAGARAMHAYGDEGKWASSGMRDFYRKYAEEVLRAALSSLRPAEVGSATTSKDD